MWMGNADTAQWYRADEWRKTSELAELRRLVTTGDRVLEIGAHQGFTGLLCAAFAGPEGTVISVEAFPFNAMVAQAQLAANPALKNLQFLNAAASDRPGTVRIARRHNSSVAAGGGGIEVPALTGDSLDEEHGPFDVLKLDVEGFESSALKGCRAILARRPKLAIELHMDTLGNFGSSVNEVMELIDAATYQGTMFIRPDYFTTKPFSLADIPKTGIANIFLWPRETQ
jgi:FkbM family methyltransferase